MCELFQLTTVHEVQLFTFPWVSAMPFGKCKGTILINKLFLQPKDGETEQRLMVCQYVLNLMPLIWNAEPYQQ